MPLRRDLSRAALLASASKALDSPRNAFCASKGMRCTTSDSCSAGAATGAELRVSAVKRRGDDQAQHQQPRQYRQQIEIR